VTLAGETVSENGRILLPPERRRLGMVFQDLARALVPEPDMLLMDEALSSLDRDEAFALAVRVAIMDHGKVAFIGTVEDARSRTLLS